MNCWRQANGLRPASRVTTEGLRVMLGVHLEIFPTEYSKGHQSQFHVSGSVLVCMTPIKSKPSNWLPPYLSWGLCLYPYLSFNLFGRLIIIWQLNLAVGQWSIINDVKQMSQNSWRKYKVKTRGLDPNPIAPAQSKCCLPLSTNVQDITETAFPGAPASRERWYILVMISKKRQTNHMHEFRILCSHFVHIMFASGAHWVFTRVLTECSQTAHWVLLLGW